MNKSQIENLRQAFCRMKESINRNEHNALPTHSFGVRFATLAIKNETILTGGDNVGCTVEDIGFDAPPSAGDDKDDSGSEPEPEPQRIERTRNSKSTPNYQKLDGLPLEGCLRLPQVLAAIPVSKSSWWAGVKTGRYPAPVKLGPRTTAWRVSDIRSYIERLDCL